MFKKEIKHVPKFDRLDQHNHESDCFQLLAAIVVSKIYLQYLKVIFREMSYMERDGV